MAAAAVEWALRVGLRRQIWAFVGGVSVRTKILGIVLALVVSLGAVVSLQVRALLIAALRDGLQKNSLVLARHVVAQDANPLVAGDLAALNTQLRESLRYTPDAAYILVLDSTGHALAHTFDGTIPADLAGENVLPPGEASQVQALKTADGQVWDAAVRVASGPIGVVRVGLSEQQLWRTVNASTWQVLLSIMFISLIGIVGAAVFTWLLTRPILELVAATERVGHGDYSPRVARRSNDEIGALAGAFNAMAAQLGQAEVERAGREKLRQFYLKRVIRAQEEERQRIARELHDETGQALATVMFGLRNADEAQTREETHHHLRDLQQLLVSTLDRVRRLAFDLRPSALDDLGLEAALRRLLAEYQQRFGIIAALRVVGLGEERLAQETETAVYRIVQEALTNAAKYAACRRVSVSVQAGEGRLSVIIEDDGRGFDVKEALGSDARHRKLGLYGMHERAELIGGSLEIESEPGRGTTVYLRVPLEPMEDDGD